MGKVFRFNKDVDTDQIIASQYLLFPTVEEMKVHAFESLDANFASEVRPGDFVVSDDNCAGRPQGTWGARYSCAFVRKDLLQELYQYRPAGHRLQRAVRGGQDRRRNFSRYGERNCNSRRQDLPVHQTSRASAEDPRSGRPDQFTGQPGRISQEEPLWE